jgi:histidine phosphotransferase ChpT
MRVVAVGDRARLPAGVKEVLAEGAIPNPLDAHAVQPLYAALLAREARMGVTATQEENRVVLGARPVT